MVINLVTDLGLWKIFLERKFRVLWTIFKGQFSVQEIYLSWFEHNHENAYRHECMKVLVLNSLRLIIFQT